MATNCGENGMTMLNLAVFRGAMLALCLLVLVALPVWGEGEAGKDNVDKETDALSIGVNIGAVIGVGKDNLDPRRSSSYLDDLGAPGDSVTRGIAFVFPDITYRFAGEQGPKLRLDAKSPTSRSGEFALNLGLIYPAEYVGELVVSALYNPFQELWRNPYLLDAARRRTDVNTYGLRGGVKSVGPVPLGIDFVWIAEDIEDDDIGRLMPDLARDGNTYIVDLHYALLRTREYDLQPKIVFAKGEMDGESSSFSSVQIGLGGRYSMGRLMFLPGISYERTVYDKDDPVFGETRKSDTYGAKLFVNYFAPFNLKDWVVSGFFGYTAGDASIDFYDTQGVGGGFFLVYTL